MVTKGDGEKEASQGVWYLHGWKLWGPGEAVVMPGDQMVWETLNNPASQAMQARPKQLAAMRRGALSLQAATAKHLLAAKSSPVTAKALLVGNTSKLGTRDVQ